MQDEDVNIDKQSMSSDSSESNHSGQETLQEML